MTKPSRRSARVNAPVPVPVRWLRSGMPVTALGTEINAHGLFLCTTQTIAVGYVMQLELALPGGAIRMMVVSRFCGETAQGRGIGVEIFSIAPTDRMRWVAHYGRLLEQSRAAERRAHQKVRSLEVSHVGS
jgi:hypothetical protein